RLPRRVQARCARPRQAGRHRARCRHIAPRPDAAEPRPVRDLAGPQPRLRRRPRDAEAWHGDVRRALRLVPPSGGRDARLAAEDGLTMSAAPLSLCGHVALPMHTGSGGFDHAAVHAATGHVYVAHTANNAVDVLDPTPAKYLYSVPNLAAVAGALVSDQSQLVFTSNRGENTIGVFAPG